MTLRGYQRSPVIQQFEAALACRGLTLRRPLVADGRIHRCDAKGKHGRGDGSYLLHLDGAIPAGGFQNWQDGAGWEDWRFNPGHHLTSGEQTELKERAAAARRMREEAETRDQASACEKAAWLWADARPALDHQYLRHKQVAVATHGVRVWCGYMLLVPMFDESGALHNVQRIWPDGRKRYLRGGRVKGCFYRIAGDPHRICIAEGFATTASINEATGFTAIVAFDVGNLRPVAEAVKKMASTAEIVIAADDDWRRRDGNIGIDKATEAARAIGAKVAVPVFGENRRDNDTDFNDLARSLGADAVRRCIDDAKAPDFDGNDKVARQPRQSEVLIELASSATLFHTPAPDNDAFADIMVNGHCETHRVRGKAFRDWLRFRYFKKKGTGCNGDAMQVAIETIAAKALYEGEARQVHVRIAEHKGNIYIDIGDDSWRAVEVTSDCWRIVNSPPVRFVRSASTRSLPFPQQGGKIELLREFCNVKTENEFVLLVGHVHGVMRPNTNYPVLVETGEQGSCKTTLFKLIGRLTDPRTPEVRSLPANEDDLIIAAKGAHLLPFDNISGIPDWLSDAFCRLSTGGGAGKRKLYSDDEEILFDGRRPIFLNGIEDVVTRGDLVDRCNILNLEVIPESKRRTEEEINAEFERQAGKIFGALLNGLVAGLRNLPTVQIADKPRMADFVLWAEACCRAHWNPGTFIGAHREGMAASVELVIEASPVGLAVRKFMETRNQWSGTAQELLEALTASVGEPTAKERDWPRRPNKLSGKLKRVAPALRKVGIHITLGERQGHSRTKLVTIEKGRPAEHQPDLSAASSATPRDSRKNTGFAADDQTRNADDKADTADDPRTVEEGVIDPANPLKNKGYANADNADDKSVYRSGRVRTAIKAAAEEIALRARVCQQCRAGLSTDPPSDPPAVQLKNQNGEDVWVHSECLRFWLQANGSGERELQLGVCEGDLAPGAETKL